MKKNDFLSDQVVHRQETHSSLGGIALIFPVHNESFIIEHTIRTYFHAFYTKIKDFEIIVVEDGSTDDTKTVLQRLGEELPLKLFMTEGRLGYQQAIIKAISHATKPWLFIVDSDYQFAAIDFWKLEPFRDNYDIILGMKSPRKDPFHRIILSKGYNFLLRRSFHVPYRDMDTGFRLIRREIASEIGSSVRHMSFFTAEFVVRAHYLNYKIIEVPVKHYERKIGSTTIFYNTKLLKICIDQFIGMRKLKKELVSTRKFNKVK
jgi:glycosyltransferase involved in cell wall biosynthesis